MNVKDIVREYLKANGYDGLWNEWDCGCHLGDLFPCTDMMGHCEPGYKTEGCSEDCGEDCEYHISRDKK